MKNSTAASIHSQIRLASKIRVGEDQIEVVLPLTKGHRPSSPIIKTIEGYNTFLKDQVCFEDIQTTTFFLGFVTEGELVKQFFSAQSNRWVDIHKIHQGGLLFKSQIDGIKTRYQSITSASRVNFYSQKQFNVMTGPQKILLEATIKQCRELEEILIQTKEALEKSEEMCEKICTNLKLADALIEKTKNLTTI